MLAFVDMYFESYLATEILKKEVSEYLNLIQRVDKYHVNSLSLLSCVNRKPFDIFILSTKGSNSKIKILEERALRSSFTRLSKDDIEYICYEVFGTEKIICSSVYLCDETEKFIL